MPVLIDGYNLLHLLFAHSNLTFEKKREELIKVLEHYNSKKRLEMLLVLDGGLSNYPLKEYVKSLTIVYSGKFKSADEWIIEFTHANKGNSLVLVTRDRALIQKCPSSVEIVDPLFFAQFLEQKPKKDPVNTKVDTSIVQKYFHEEDEEELYDADELDTLMRESNIPEQYQESEDYSSPQKSSGNKQSKKERRFQKVIKKL